MALPASVQKAADYADALEQQMRGQVQGSDPQAEEPVPASETEPNGVRTESMQDEPSEMEKLQSKYASLRGKYDAEVPRLHNQTKELEARIQQLLDENTSLRGEIAKAAEDKSYLTEQDTDNFGEDMVDLVRRGAREESAKFASEAADLKSQIAQVQEQLRQQAQQESARRESAFYAELTREFPDWETQNTDQGFLAWLNEADPTYGFQRNEALQRAFGNLDAHSVAAIFQEYRNTTRRANPLERQVTPTHTKSSGQVGSSQPHVWSQGEIEQFYHRWIHNEIPEEEAKAIEKEINDAVAAGRVRP